MRSFPALTGLLITLLNLSLCFTVASQEAAPALPAELVALDAQFQAFKKERVSSPYELEMARLNTAYLGGLDKAMAVEKAKGDLDATLALGKEKQAFSEAAEVQEKDDPSTPETLKRLRTTYRSELARISAARAASLTTLTEPLDRRLAQMEKEFTQADRLEDAKKVRTYREALAQSPKIPPPVLATGGGGFTNSLGMQFLPVKGTGVMFCIHETRRQDYAAYAADARAVDESWKKPQYRGMPCGDQDDHPVVNVSWEDAAKFCEWLSKKEGMTYRLPTDEEWSIATGVAAKENASKDATAESLGGKETTEFPWGADYPPKTAEMPGNYADTAFMGKFPGEKGMPNYTDGFPTTAPVRSLKANIQGLHDLGGNVWEWIDAWWNESRKERVLRGGSFYDHDRSYLLSSYRSPVSPGSRLSHIGFRCVMVMK